MFADTDPTLKLKSTVSNPADEYGEVVGYRGRNTRLGLDALIMTDPATDADIEDSNYAFLVPEAASEEVADGERHLYVLAEETVYGYTPEDYTGDQSLTTVEGEVFHVISPSDATKQWDREDAEVTN
jgi:hypothetical protein